MMHFVFGSLLGVALWFWGIKMETIGVWHFVAGVACFYLGMRALLAGERRNRP